MPSIRARNRLLVLAASLPLILALATHAVAEEPSLDVYYNKLDPKAQFKYKWKGKEGVVNAGVFRWEVPQSQFGTNGLDRNFTGYCAEILVPIVADKLYSFRVNSLYDPKNYDGLAGLDDAAPAAQKRALAIQELFGRYYRDPTTKPVEPDDAIALQIALWEVIQETEPVEGSPKFDLFAGDFQANYPKADAPAYVLTAQRYLNSLTGNDALFYQNPDLRGRELIRLQGIPNAAGVVAQSQFALRFAGGGAAGAAGNLANALTVGSGLGGVGGGGFGAPVGGSGGLGGFPSGAFLGTGGGSSSGGSSSAPGGGAQTFPTTPPGTTSPPTSGTASPPVGGPDTPTTPTTPTPPSTPVPAPPGVLLGVIALCTLGMWRLGVRLLASK